MVSKAEVIANTLTKMVDGGIPSLSPNSVASLREVLVAIKDPKFTVTLTPDERAYIASFESALAFVEGTLDMYTQAVVIQFMHLIDAMKETTS